MAVFAQTRVRGGRREDMEHVEAQVETTMMSAGGPPPGLMAVVVYPDGDDWILSEVWRSEAEMRDWLDSVVLPAVAATGRSVDETVVSPVWSFARP